MALSNTPQVSHEDLLYISSESTAGTYKLAVANDFFPHLTFEAEALQDRTLIPTKTPYPSTFFSERGQRIANWSMEALLQPSGTAGTAPEIDNLLKTVLEESISAGVSVTYAPLTDPAGVVTLHHFLQSIETAVIGALPTKFSIKYDELLKIAIEGLGKDRYVQGKTEVSTGGALIGAAIVPVDAPNQLVKNGLVKFGTEDNSGAGYTITKIESTQITVSPVLAAAVSAGDDVEYLQPAWSTITENALTPYTGTFTFASSTYAISKFDLSIDLGNVYIEKLFGEATPVTTKNVKRLAATCSMDIVLRANEVDEFVNTIRTDTSKAISILFGNTAGSLVEIPLPIVKFEEPKIGTKEDDLVILSLSGICFAGSGLDEFSIIFK